MRIRSERTHGSPQALDLLEQAIERDPRYGRRAQSAMCLGLCGYAVDGSERRPSARAPTRALASMRRRAIVLWTQPVPWLIPHWPSSGAWRYYRRGMIAIDRTVALALNPSLLAAGTGQRRCSGSVPANPISRSSISRPRCASARAIADRPYILTCIGVCAFLQPATSTRRGEAARRDRRNIPSLP